MQSASTKNSRLIVAGLLPIDISVQDQTSIVERNSTYVGENMKEA